VRARPARSATLPALALAAGVAATVGLSLPGLGLVGAGLRHPSPFAAEGGPTGLLETGWRTDWTTSMVPPARLADLGIHSLLMIALALTLLALCVGCANSVALVLARASARRQELALRTALGATPRTLLARLLREAAPLLALGSALGLLLGMSSILLLHSGWPAALPRTLAALPGPVAILVAVGLPTGATLVAALLPARLAGRTDLARELTVGTRATASRRDLALRRALVIASLAASVILLTGTGSLLRGAPHHSPAWSRTASDRVVTFELRLPPGRYPDLAHRAAAARALVERVRSVPGVIDTSVSSPGAWSGLGARDLVHVFSAPPLPAYPTYLIEATYQAVSPGFFGMLGFPVVQGRDFNANDNGAPGVVVVNEAFAHRALMSRDLAGKKVQLGHAELFGDWYPVVGIVRDAPAVALGVAARPEPRIYLPAFQNPPSSLGLTVETRGDPLKLASAIERAVRSMDPTIVISEPRTLAGRLEELGAPLRWFGSLFSLLATLSVLVAAGGVYALMAYMAALRRREIGIRIALGARTRDVARLFLGESVRVARTATLIGLFGALILTRLLEFLFQGVPGFDPLVFAGVAGFLAVIAVVATAGPVLRASRTEPREALQAE
jgi:putative ABC transport system permease protein